MIVGLFEYVEFNLIVHFFDFRLETPFLGKFIPKNQNCQFKLKFDTCNQSQSIPYANSYIPCLKVIIAYF